jgi:aryl-alcohol dehydrogenase-like predicted oxidoreductase
VTSPIIGPRTMAQLEDNLGAVDVSFSEEDLAGSTRLVPPGQMVSPFYQADWGPHQYR